MPNHVMNEVIFRNVDATIQDRIKALCCNADGKVDFELLLPLPKNIWWGSVGQKHRKFPGNALDWSVSNWGTKWNAYSCEPVEQSPDTLRLQFDTAWNPPRGWLLALFNTLLLSFEHNWLDEGEDRGHSARFTYDVAAKFSPMEWEEELASEEMQKHLHLLRWGCEEFPPDEDEAEEDGAA